MNISKYLRTVSYLKPQQIYYQFKYRLFGYRYSENEKYSTYRDSFNISIPILDEDERYVNRFNTEDILENQIELLHEKADWEPAKWNFPDKTHLWNFNLHYFEYGIALAAKYKETKDERYYQKLVSLYSDWHKACFKNKGGDAWHPYTISLRLKNLLIIGGIVQNKDWFGFVVDDVYKQYRFLINNQEKHLLGNHYFENLVTIYLCSIFFKEEWIRQEFEHKLMEEIKEQILPDGMHYERSFMYHNLILEDLIRIWLVSEGDFKVFLLAYIKRMTDCVYTFEKEGRLPAFNDAAANVAKRKGQLIHTIEELAGYAPQKRQLEDAGYYKLENESFSLIMDVGEFAPTYISGHGQCDALSIELYYKEFPILVNSGTYQYQTDKRAYFRGTASHNTLKVVGVEQSECWGEHRTARRIKNIYAEWNDHKIVGCIKDYQGNKLKRQIELKEKIVIMDKCLTPHINYWHIHPSNSIKQISGREIEILIPSGEILSMKVDKEFQDIDGWYSEEFGRIEENSFFKSTATTIEISRKNAN